MPNEVLCQISLFQHFQTVTWPDGQEDHFTLSELPTAVSKLCHVKKVPTVHLYGEDKFLEGMIMQIQAEEMIKYGKTQLTFEVN